MAQQEAAKMVSGGIVSACPVNMAENIKTPAALSLFPLSHFPSGMRVSSEWIRKLN